MHTDNTQRPLLQKRPHISDKRRNTQHRICTTTSGRPHLKARKNDPPRVPEPVQGLRRQLMLRFPKRSLSGREIRRRRPLEAFYRSPGVVSFRLMYQCNPQKDNECYFYLLRSVVRAHRPSSPQIQNKQSRFTSMTSDVRRAG